MKCMYFLKVLVILMFRTMYNNVKMRSATPAGDKYRDIYIEIEPWETDINGNCLNKSRFPKKVKSGEVVDIQQQINSYLESTRIETILRNMAKQPQQAISFDDSLPSEDLTDLGKNLYEIKEAAALAPKVEAAYKQLQNNVITKNDNFSSDEISALRALIGKKEVIINE